jgi:osmotically-inducible protein OsmY
MADRYPYRDDPYRGDRGWRDERGWTDRAGDEVRSWFGDDEAERRRRMDERETRARFSGERFANYDYGWASDRGRGYGGDYPDAPRGERWDRPDRWSTDDGRAEYGYRGPQDEYTSRPRGYGYGYRGGYTGDPWRGPNWAGLPGGSYYGPERASGSHAGRGPKGYQRSDDRIREEVCDRLTDAPHVDASEIEITVRGGEVTLTGSVRERDDKRRAEDLVEHVSGVREVHNNLRVTGWNSSGTRSTGSTMEPTTTGSARK